MAKSILSQLLKEHIDISNRQAREVERLDMRIEIVERLLETYYHAYTCLQKESDLLKKDLTHMREKMPVGIYRQYFKEFEKMCLSNTSKGDS